MEVRKAEGGDNGLKWIEEWGGRIQRRYGHPSKHLTT